MSANAENPSRDTGALEEIPFLDSTTEDRSSFVTGETLATLIGIRCRARALVALIEDLRLGECALTSPMHARTAAALLQAAAAQLGLGVNRRTRAPRLRKYRAGEE